MISNFNEEAQEILNKAKIEMLDLKHPYIGTEHLVLSILKNNNEIKEKSKQFISNYKSEINKYLSLIYQLFKQQTYDKAIQYINLL